MTSLEHPLLVVDDTNNVDTYANEPDGEVKIYETVNFRCCVITRRRFWEILICFSMILALFGDTFAGDALSADIPAMISENIFNTTEAGYLLGASSFFYFGGKLITGRATDLFNARRTFLVSVFILSLTSVGLGFVNNLSTAFICYTIVSIASAGAWSCFTKLIGNWYYPKHYGIYWGIVSTSTAVFSVAVYSVLGAIITNLSWRWTYWILAIIFMVICFILYFTLYSEPEDLGLDSPTEMLDMTNVNNDGEFFQHPLHQATLKQALCYFAQSPQFWFMMFGDTFITMSACFEVFVPQYFKNKFDVDAGSSSTLTSAYATGTVVAVILGGILYTVLSKRGLFYANIATLFLLVVIISILWSIQDLNIHWAGFFVFVYGFAVTIPYFYPISIYSIECGGKYHSGIVVGIIDGVSNIGAAAYSIVAGQMIGKDDWPSFLMMTLFTSLVSLIFMGLFLYVDYSKPVPTQQLDFIGTARLFGCFKKKKKLNKKTEVDISLQDTSVALDEDNKEN